MKDRAREELERLLEEWVAERTSLRDLPLPESTPEAELLRLLRAGEAEAGAGLTASEARSAVRRVLERASAGGGQRSTRPAFRAQRSLALGLALCAALVVALLTFVGRGPAPAPPPPGPTVVKEIRFEMIYEGRVVSLELTAFGPEPLAREASNDTSIPLP